MNHKPWRIAPGVALVCLCLHCGEEDAPSPSGVGGATTGGSGAAAGSGNSGGSGATAGAGGSGAVAGQPGSGGQAGSGGACAGMQVIGLSGDVQQGGSLVLRGCGFGTKDPAPPVLWDTVDNQPSYAALVDGDVVPTDDPHPWMSNGSPWAERMQYSTSRPQRGTRTAHYHGPPGAYGDAFIGWVSALSGGTQRLLYVNWWYRPAIPPDAEGGSNKFIRIWDNGNGYGTRISWTQMHLTYSGSTASSWTSWISDGVVGEWNNHEIVVDSDQHEIIVWLNTKLQHHATDYTKDPAYDNQGLNVALVGFDHGMSDYTTQHTEVSEVYVDVTRARVLVGDAATWSACTRREIQVPVTWRDDEITITVQQGAFADFSGKYLFVVDAQENITEGFPLP